MRRSHSRKTISCLALVVLVGIAVPVVGAPVSFVPVQAGAGAPARSVQPYALDRLTLELNPAAAAAVAAHLAGKDGADLATGLPRLDAALAELGTRRVEAAFRRIADKARAAQVGLDRFLVVRFTGEVDIPAAAARLAKLPEVRGAAPDWRVFPAAVPADPLYADHWGHHNTGQLPSYDWTAGAHTGPAVGTPGFDAGAEIAWDGVQGYGDSTVVIAIVDTGVDLAHPDLVDRLVAGYDFGDGDSNPDDDSAAAGHGTACAGVAAAARNGIGSVGIAAGCRIMPCKVADVTGAMYMSAVRSAVTWAADHGADVISMSLGTATGDAATSAALQYAHDAGVVLLAATGNENAAAIRYPASNQYVIGVGAASPCGERKRSSCNPGEVNPGVNTDPNGYTCDGERWWGSNYGSAFQDAADAVDVIAPTILPTTDIHGSGGYEPGDDEPFFNGTSCATPYAAGVCALIKSVNPGWTPDQVRDRLCNTARDIVSVESAAGWDRYTGYGMVDAAAAVDTTGPGVTAMFAVSDTFGCRPLQVLFTDLSTGDITSRLWDFGDGWTDTTANPTHTYIYSGDYVVSLRVEGSHGFDVFTYPDTIKVRSAPTPWPRPSVTSGQVPLTVTFGNWSYPDPFTSEWDFGDGSPPDTTTEPTHVYTQPGVYTVTLTVSNTTCGSSSTTKTITVEAPPPPQAAFVFAPAAGYAPLTVTFTDSSTGDVAHWNWDFGDGTPADTTQNPVHVFTDGGVFTVSLTVNDIYGGQTTATDTVTVIGPPQAAFDASPTAGCVPLVVAFTDSSTGTVERWWWDFGDGSPPDTTRNPSHVYTAPGSYTVTLVAGNAAGDDTLVVADLVHAGELRAYFSGVGIIDQGGHGQEPVYTSPPMGCPPLTVGLADSSLGDVQGRLWNFGDGSPPDTSRYPLHVYADPGSYDVTLIVIGSCGTDTLTRAGYVTVLPTDPPAAGFTASTVSGPSPLTVAFQDSSAGAVLFHLWDFGDGSPPDTSANPVHVYQAPGSYTVTLVAYSWCSTDTLVRADYITVTTSTGADDLPRAFALEPAHPNPFNPATTLAFTLPADAHVRLEVFDAAGRRVDLLVDRPLAAGRHTVLWRPADRASGVYFARLRAGDRTAVQRLMLVK